MSPRGGRDAIGKSALRVPGRFPSYALDCPNTPFENNFAERMVRPAGVLRQNSQSRRSENGAAAQAALISIYRTLILRGHNRVAAIAKASRPYAKTGTVPSLPSEITANGWNVTTNQDVTPEPRRRR